MTSRPGRSIAPRLLLWTSSEGKPCYLIGDDGGRVSRAADDVEDAQLDLAAGLLDHAADMLADDRATAPQLHYLAACLAESLHQVCRVAESRGARLPTPGPMN